MATYFVELTDTFGGEANYSWVYRYNIDVPELTYFGYDGFSNYVAANKRARIWIMRKAKKFCGLNGIRGKSEWYGDYAEFRPYRQNKIMFIAYS